MASYRASYDNTKRSAGQSAVAGVAYSTRSDMTDERTGTRWNYTKLGGCEYQETFYPDGTSSTRAEDKSALWNAAEMQDAGAKARIAKYWELNIPHELSAAERRELIRDECRHLAQRYGCAVTGAIHQPGAEGDNRNIHAHVYMTTRQVSRDEAGQIVMGDKISCEWENKKCKAQGLPYTKDQLTEDKKDWAERGAEYLERAGFRTEADRYRVGYLDKETQHAEAIERGDHEGAARTAGEATEHKGRLQTALERKGAALTEARETKAPAVAERAKDADKSIEPATQQPLWKRALEEKRQEAEAAKPATERARAKAEKSLSPDERRELAAVRQALTHARRDLAAFLREIGHKMTDAVSGLLGRVRENRAGRDEALDQAGVEMLDRIRAEQERQKEHKAERGDQAEDKPGLTLIQRLHDATHDREAEQPGGFLERFREQKEQTTDNSSPRQQQDAGTTPTHTAGPARQNDQGQGL